MTQVKLPRDVAQEIEQFRKDGFGNKDIIEASLSTAEGGALNDYASNVSFDDILAALVFGYDVKGTPHEEIRDYYRDAQNAIWDYPDDATRDRNYHRNSGIVHAVDFVLHELNITIEGVNDR